jgi:cytidine deaminase
MLSESEIAALIDYAMKARECAYAPYSGYKVGAAAVDDQNRVFFGANVENASYGLSLCAERAAIASAVSTGARSVKALILVTESVPPVTPCGACRQWLAEFADDDLQIIAANTSRRFRRFTLGALLPEAFRFANRELEAAEP